jgi:DNA-binding Xre family transcriptional regulator
VISASGGVIMAVSYNNLWKLLIDRKLKRTELIDICGISSNVLAKLGKDEPVSMESLEKICVALNCNIEDVVQFIEG